MPTVFANNTSGVVISGGTTAPSSGASESWTVTSSSFPATLAAGQAFHVADPAQPSEKIQVTAISGSGPYTWTVIRGDEGTTPVVHSSSFTVSQAVTSGEFANFTQIPGLSVSYPDQISALALGLRGPLGITALAAAIANRNSTRVDIPVIGDSITEGIGMTGAGGFAGRWVSQANRAVRAAFPTAGNGAAGGLGFIPIQSTSGSPTFTWPVTLSSGSPAVNFYGPNRGGATVTAAATWTWTAPAGTTSARIMYYDVFGSAGSFTYQVGSGGVTTVTRSQTATDVLTASIPVTGGQVLTVSWASGTVFMDGIVHYAGDESSGITFHGCGHDGWDATTGAAGWNQSSLFSWQQVFSSAFPNIAAVGIMLGVNDANTGAGNETGAQFQSNLSTLISTVRGAATSLASIPVLLIIPYQPNVTMADPGGWAAYPAAIRAVASSVTNTAVIDLNYRMPSVASNSFGGSLFYDTVHPAAPGHALIGEIAAAGVRIP